MQTVLVADDDPHIRDVVCFALDKAGFKTETARDGREALERANSGKFDLLVLDIMMPEMEGTEVCRELRGDSAMPVVFLTSRDDEIDRIVGLELGGDDYVTKPFSPRELVARVKAILRRSGMQAAALTVGGLVEYGRLKLDLDGRKAWWEGREVALTATEFGLIRALMGKPGKVFLRAELMQLGYEIGRIVSDRTIDSHIRRVRRKFAAHGGAPIQTVHGIGYKIAAC